LSDLQTMNYILVFIGGGLGSVIRFALSQLIPNTKPNLPLATLLSNVLACAVFALIVSISQSKLHLQEGVKFMLLAGFCGGLSTFSAFSNETFLMLKQGLHLYAFGNIVLNLIMCLGVFYWFFKYSL
jgi:fluoride exporter